MQKNTALLTAGFIFSLVALIHFLRLILGKEIIILGYLLPPSVSLIGFIVSLLLAIWMFRARKS